MKYISMIYKSFQGAWVIWGVAGIRQYLFYTKKEAIKQYNAEAKREKFETLKGYVIYFVSDLNSATPKLRIITKEIYDQLEFVPIAFHVKAEIETIK